MTFLKNFGVDLLGARMIFMIFFWRILGSIYWALKWFWWFFKNELQHVYWAINIMRVYKSHNHNVSNKNHALQRLASLWLRKQHTILVDSVKHSLSIWNSVKGTKRCFCYLLDPERRRVVQALHLCELSSLSRACFFIALMKGLGFGISSPLKFNQESFTSYLIQFLELHRWLNGLENQKRQKQSERKSL